MGMEMEWGCLAGDGAWAETTEIRVGFSCETLRSLCG